MLICLVWESSIYCILIPQTIYVHVYRQMQEVVLDKHIRLLDSPGVVMATGNSDTHTILRNCVKVRKVVINMGHSIFNNWCINTINNPFIGLKWRSIIKTHNFILANQINKYFVYRWLHAHAVFDLKCLPAFVRASDVFSSVLSIR